MKIRIYKQTREEISPDICPVLIALGIALSSLFVSFISIWSSFSNGKTTETTDKNLMAFIRTIVTPKKGNSAI